MQHNIYHTFLALLLFLSLAAPKGYGQVSEENYLKDEIYLLLKESHYPEGPKTSKQDPAPLIDTAVAAVVLQGLLGLEQLESVSAPFRAAKGYILEQVLRIRLRNCREMDTILQRLNAAPEVVYAERIPRALLSDSYLPDDLGINQGNGQWYLHRIQAPEAWAIAKGDKAVKVAITDNAVYLNHPDLKDNVWINPGEIADNGIDDDDNGYVDDVQGYDVAENDKDPNPSNSSQLHGTHVAGLAGAVSDNSVGIASIGFKVSIIAVKIARNNQNLEVSSPLEGLTYAIAAGADVINCSWGTPVTNYTFDQVMAFAAEKKALIVAASGNDGLERKLYPAAYPGVIAVAATDSLDQVAAISNYGDWVSVCAPGRVIKSTIPPLGYTVFTGTSMAAPIVSGLLGLMKGHYPLISNEQLTTCLLQTTDNIEATNKEKQKNKIGTGRINAYRAIRCVDDLKKGITSVKEKQQEKLILNLYPNPAREEVTLLLKVIQPGLCRISITDVMGRSMYTAQQCYTMEGTAYYKIHTGRLSPGVYNVKVQQETKYNNATLVLCQ